MEQKAQSGQKYIVKAVRQPMEEKCTKSANDAADDKNDDIDGYGEKWGNEIGKRKKETTKNFINTDCVY